MSTFPRDWWGSCWLPELVLACVVMIMLVLIVFDNVWFSRRQSSSLVQWSVISWLVMLLWSLHCLLSSSSSYQWLLPSNNLFSHVSLKARCLSWVIFACFTLGSLQTYVLCCCLTGDLTDLHSWRESSVSSHSECSCTCLNNNQQSNMWNERFKSRRKNSRRLFCTKEIFFVVRSLNE